MIGHSKIFQELTRLADKGELRHSYMFFGPEGVGKKTLALKLAHHLEFGALEENKVLSDANLLLPTEGSLGIDAARSAREFLFQKPNHSKKRTLIIDDGELLTQEAGNALLKIAEEPPESALIILIVRDLEQISPILASRFEKIYFNPLSQKEIEEWLVMQKNVSKTEAKKIAEDSFGRPGLALRMLEDENFAALQQKARKFISLSPPSLKAFIKEMLEDENFQLSAFLDALILELSWSKNINLDLWHKVLELRHKAEFFGLNPRIQLENLHRYAKLAGRK